MADEIERINTIRREVDKLKHDLALMCEPSRELSLAITKLDEARLWAMEAIAIRATTRQPDYAANTVLVDLNTGA